MNLLLFLFFGILQNPGHCQNTCDITLSKTLNESRMGLWATGDYKIYIEIQPLEESFRNDYKSLMNAIENQNNFDSATLSLYRVTAERCLMAANQLQAAANEFDLRSLVVYVGLYNEEQNKGNSYIVDLLTRQSVEKGNAAVFYKGVRVFTLKKHVQSDIFRSDIQIYYDDPGNCAYKYIGHLNW